MIHVFQLSTLCHLTSVALAISANIPINHMAPKLELKVYSFVADSMALATVSLAQSAQKCTALGELVTKNTRSRSLEVIGCVINRKPACVFLSLYSTSLYAVSSWIYASRSAGFWANCNIHCVHKKRPPLSMFKNLQN